MFLAGVLRLRLAPCLSTDPEILQYAPRAHLMQVRHRAKVRGANYPIVPRTPIAEKPKIEPKEMRPKYNIWLTKEHGFPSCTIEDALTMHMEYADPAMLNNLNGYVYADMEFDMTTKKKTKFMKVTQGLLEFPNHFEYGPPKKLAVFCSTPEEMAIAKEFEVLYCGGEDLIRQFKTGVISRDAIAHLDFILSTLDDPALLAPLRSALREKAPKPMSGTVHDDIRFLLDKFTKGVIYKIDKPSEELGKSQIPIGKMSQGMLSLVENFEYMVDHLSAIKPKAKDVAPYVKNITIIAPPSAEQFKINVEIYVKGFQFSEKDKAKKQEKASEDIEEDIEAAAAQASR